MFLGLWAVGQSSLVKIEMVKQCTILNIRFPNQMEECNKVVQLGLVLRSLQPQPSCILFDSRACHVIPIVLKNLLISSCFVDCAVTMFW
jgi:hypothetical protein